MYIPSKIVMCWLLAVAAAVGYANPARAAERVPGGVMADAVARAGPVALATSRDLASDRHAARREASVWRDNGDDVSPAREIPVEPYRHRRPDKFFQSFGSGIDRTAPAEYLATRSRNGLATRSRNGAPPEANQESATRLAGMFRAASELLPGNIPSKATKAAEQPVVAAWDEQSGGWVESGRDEVGDERSGEVLGGQDAFGLPSVVSPLSLQSLNTFDWLVILTVLLIVAVRLGLWRYLNHAMFLWTAQWQGVTVAAGGDYRRSRRGRPSRSSSWTRRSGSRRSSWSPYGSRPSRRRSGHQGHSRRRTASKPHSSRSAPPRDRRHGRERAREYVVSDVVFTNSGPILRSVKPPYGGLLSYANDSPPPRGQKPGDRKPPDLQGGLQDRAQE